MNKHISLGMWKIVFWIQVKVGLHFPLCYTIQNLIGITKVKLSFKWSLAKFEYYIIDHNLNVRETFKFKQKGI